MAGTQTLTMWYGQDGRLHKAPIASFESVSKHCGQTHPLANFSLEVCGAELVALLGPNGPEKRRRSSYCLGWRETQLKEPS